jgi:hypothetical protein
MSLAGTKTIPGTDNAPAPAKRQNRPNLYCAAINAVRYLKAGFWNSCDFIFQIISVTYRTNFSGIMLWVMFGQKFDCLKKSFGVAFCHFPLLSRDI